jgi:hypothetical protein
MSRISFDSVAWQRFCDAYAALLATAQNDNAPLPPLPKPVEVTSDAPITWGAKVSPTFRARVRWIADTLKIDANWIMACMAWESGESFSA